MEYDKEKIGERIRDCRRKMPGKQRKRKSQDELAEDLGYQDRATVNRWEKGEVLPSLDIMLKMCGLFKCELGHLLCEYDEKTRNAADIHAVTGLTEEAIDTLSEYNGCEECDYLNFISLLIANKKEPNTLEKLFYKLRSLKQRNTMINSLGPTMYRLCQDAYNYAKEKNRRPNESLIGIDGPAMFCDYRIAINTYINEIKTSLIEESRRLYPKKYGSCFSDDELITININEALSYYDLFQSCDDDYKKATYYLLMSDLVDFAENYINTSEQLYKEVE